MLKVFTAVLIMAAVTYLIRVLPIAVFRKQLKSPFLKSFLHYVPFAVLGALTFPDILYSTDQFLPALVGTLVALFLSYREKSLVVVASAAILAAYITGLFA